MAYSYYQGRFFPRNPSKYRGNIKEIIYRSGWEKKLMQHFDMNPNVLEWSSEELAIPYFVPEDNKIHRYFPDFIAKVKQKDGKERVYMYEVKPEKQTKPPKMSKNNPKFIEESFKYYINELKWKAASAYCEQRGWTFALLTENDLGV